MSVNGEFGRALENVLAAVEMLPTVQATPHRAALERARLSDQPDLSSAARTALEALHALAEADLESDRLAELAGHLDAHCRAILGLPGD